MAFQYIELIKKKRESKILSYNEIKHLIDGYVQGHLADYQMSAFLMACFLNGLNEDESSHLTDIMLHSGTVLDLSHIVGIKVDKHSTGGVGDKLSLILAPMVASYGVSVPMVSGRGLGHTGGTLDKLESIPGFNVNVDMSTYRTLVEKHGLVLAGQTKEMAPADKKMYALRDVTATVESIPLIAGSIMSKKLAEGIDALVLDVKFGSGAFMKTQEEAIKLAQTLVDIGLGFEKNTLAFITNMNRPTGKAIGNWLEVMESIDVLKGSGPKDTQQLSCLLGGAMLFLAGKAKSIEEGYSKGMDALENGQALSKFREIVDAQGGDVTIIDHPESRGESTYHMSITSKSSGYLKQLDAYSLGSLSVHLGAGRVKKEDDVDPLAGIKLHKQCGDFVSEGETLMTLYTNKELDVIELEQWALSATTLDSNSEKPDTLVTHILDKDGLREYSL